MKPTGDGLLDRLRRDGSRADWDRFSELYGPLVEHWARRACPRPDDVADLVQDVFVRVMERLPSFAGSGERSFLAWLRAVTINCGRDLGRRRSVRSGVESVELDGVAAEDEGLRQLALAEERDMVVRRAMQVMQSDFESTTWRACWECVAADRPAAEVAAELGVSVEVVYSACYRVVRRLRQEMAGLWR